MMRSMEQRSHSPFLSSPNTLNSFLTSHFATTTIQQYSVDEMEVCAVIEKFRKPQLVKDFSIFDACNPFLVPEDNLSSLHNRLLNTSRNTMLNYNNIPLLPHIPTQPKKIIRKEVVGKTQAKKENRKKIGNGINILSKSAFSDDNNLNKDGTTKELNEAVNIITSLKNSVNSANNSPREGIKKAEKEDKEIEKMKEFPVINCNARLNDLNGIKVPFSITMYKRLNGNQPWVESHISPPMIGKMRKVMIEFEKVPRPIQLRVDIKPICSRGNQSTLVISESNRIYKKTQKVEGCDSASYVIDSSTQSQVKTLYLKPCWVCFGPRKDRPEFQVVISVVDLRTNNSEILHCWNTEIHCHKMESSMKGKSMETNCPPSSLVSAFYL